jgi:CubicO group peptidase (beta-lactamase class C family)
MNFSKLSLLLVLCAVPAHADVVDTYVQAEMTKRHIPGLSFVLVKHKQIVRASNYGLANVELNVPVNEHTSFEIASMTKQFTDAAILLLAEQGRLSIDDRITNYFDRYIDDGLTVIVLINLRSGGAAGEIDASQFAAGFPFGLYRTKDWEEIGVPQMKSFTFIGCKEISARPNGFFSVTPQEQCIYKITSGSDAFISIALNADGKVAYIEPYE